MWSGCVALALGETSSVKYLMLEAFSLSKHRAPGTTAAIPEPVLISGNADWQSAVPTRIQLIWYAGSPGRHAASLMKTKNYSVKLL